MTSPVDTEEVSAEELAAFREYQRRNADPAVTEMVNAGAAPVVPDVNALLEQMKQLQNRVDQMSVAQGIPSDPIAAAVQNLVHHVKARKAAIPHVDFTELLDELEALPEEITSKDSELVRVLVDETAKLHHELSYLPELASTLHKTVLKEGK